MLLFVAMSVAVDGGNSVGSSIVLWRESLDDWRILAQRLLSVSLRMVGINETLPFCKRFIRGRVGRVLRVTFHVVRILIEW